MKQFNQQIISRHLLHLFLIILIITQVIPFSLGCHDDERNALLNFKSYFIHSYRLSSWKGQNCCSWYGILCSNDSFHVVSVDLHANYRSIDPLYGALLPPSLFDLSHLQYLDLSYNDFNYSKIPYQIGNLKHLTHLDLSYSQLSGSIPPQCTNLSSLRYLDVSSCSIQGSLPASITNLSQLEYLDLSDNNITGKIPSSMSSNLKNLKVLTLSGNNLLGSIPESICEISSLQKLDLGANNLSGTIPSCILKLGNLRSLELYENSIEGTVSLISLINKLNLTYIDLESNRVTVEINHPHPPLPSKLQQIQIINLNSCNIKGYIPGYFCNLTNLQSMSLFNTSITGTIPSCLSNLQNLGDLNLSSNNLQGTISHPVFSNMTSFPFTLDLSRNNFRGYLPHPPQRPALFDLSNNKFIGGISTEVGETLSNVKYVSLSDNKLSDSIPSSICSNEYSRLEYLDLSMNQLRGTIPSSIQNCSSIIALNLGYNNISGSIPTFIGLLKNLKVLYLRSNRFNGLIPKEISYLPELQILDLATNNLSGPISVEIGYMKMLTSTPKNSSEIRGKAFVSDVVGMPLQMMIKGTMRHSDRLYNYNMGIDLSCNNLNGNIPEQMCLFQGLPILNLSNNCLSGKIPTRVGNMTGLQSLDLSFNKFSGNIPQSLTSIDSLAYLNLSYNNLSGRIPRGSHFETLSVDGSAYVGNPLLCGVPIEKRCKGDPVPTGSTDVPTSILNDEDDNEDAKKKLLFYGIVFLGFGVGFWGLFLILLLKKGKWWFGYWRIVDKIAAKI